MKGKAKTASAIAFKCFQFNTCHSCISFGIFNIDYFNVSAHMLRRHVTRPQAGARARSSLRAVLIIISIIIIITTAIRDVALERSPFTCYCKHRKRIKQRVNVYLHTLLHITDKLTLKNKHSAYTQKHFLSQ